MERAGIVTAFPRAALALIPVPLLTTGCGGFQSPLSPAGEQAASIHSLFWLMMAVCGFMYILVLAALGFSVARAWRRRGASPGEPSITPSDQGLNRGLLAWAALIVVGLTVLIIAIAVSILFVGSIFTPWALVWGAVPVAIGLTIWFWPQRPRSQTGPLRVRSR